jgi:DNA repair protein RecN (Recombination protein N)
MLKSLLIKNYALIDEITIEFADKLSIITGETGAGKSILLGAVQLLLGGRADRNLLSDPDAKCLVEAVFSDYPKTITEILNSHDLDDYGDSLIIRREITPSGKSRAFVNDTPVTLAIVKTLASELIDLNRQHDLLDVQKVQFHYGLVDSIALKPGQYDQYYSVYKERQAAIKKVETLRAELATLTQERNYIQFQLNEVEELNLQSGEYIEIERNIEKLEQSQEITSLLSETQDMMINREDSLSDAIRTLRNRWEAISNIDKVFNAIAERIAGLGEEIIDISSEISGMDDLSNTELSLEELHTRRDCIASLLLKHGVNTEEELIDLQDGWQVALSKTDNLQVDIDKLDKNIQILTEKVQKAADGISKKRISHFGQLEKAVNERLVNLSMDHADIKVKHTYSEEPHKLGIDDLEIVFSSNKGSEYRSIKDIASGGEMSRLMLCMKAAGADSIHLPTLVFDEIDAGVSGNVAHKMGTMLKSIADNHQVIVITHSPQVAAKADLHLEVYKDNTGDKAISSLKALNKDEQVIAIAKMLSGETPTETAIKNAKELVKTK